MDFSSWIISQIVDNMSYIEQNDIHTNSEKDFRKIKSIIRYYIIL